MGGCVEREDELDRLAAFGSVHRRAALRPDGRDGVFQIQAVPGMTDGLGVIGARAGAFRGRPPGRTFWDQRLDERPLAVGGRNKLT